MQRAAFQSAVAAGMIVACSIALGQQPASPAPAGSAPSSVVSPSVVSPAAASPVPQDPPTPAIAGGKLHGVVKSGNIPLPGVTVTAANTLTGKRYSTTTDLAGAWSIAIPQNGRYVIRTQFAAFAPGSQEALLNASSHDQTSNFD